MKRTTQRFALHRTSEAHALDDVQALLIADVERQFNELWPSDTRPPDALMSLFVSVAAMIDYTSRTPRGRAGMKARLARMLAHHAELLDHGHNDLLKHAHAPAVVPGLLAAAIGHRVEGQDTAGAVSIVDAVDAWLSDGD